MAWATLPAASAPLGTTTLPSTSTGAATLALNWSPELLSFEPTASARRTVMTVPASMVTSFLPNHLDDGCGAWISDVSSDGKDLVEQAVKVQTKMSSDVTTCKRRCTNTSCVGSSSVPWPIAHPKMRKV